MDSLASPRPPAATVQFRPMAETDLATARELWSAAEGVEVAEGDEPAQLAAYLRRNPGISQVAFAGARLVGAVLAGHDGRRGWLYHLAVAADQRGAGIGREMVDRCLAALKAEGLTRVLILVSTDNPRGRAFWCGRGWEPLDTAEAMGIDL